MNLKYTYYSYE